PELRKKWKYLRDQFSVELGKAKPPRSGDPADESNIPKWPYFKSMVFLKDIVKPRPSSSNLIANKPPFTHDETSENTDTDDNGESNTTPNRLQEEDENLEFEANSQSVSPTFTPTPSQRTVFQKRQRCQDNAKHNGTIIEIEKKKAKVSEDVFNNRQADSDDLLFFRSLLPYVEKIPPHLKLKFRTRILQVVDDFAFPSDQFQHESLSSLTPLTPSTSFVNVVSPCGVHHASNDSKIHTSL
ncbi:hypothetical protein JTB14_022887, partial [Gonioctena quinquepunctata]